VISRVNSFEAGSVVAESRLKPVPRFHLGVLVLLPYRVNTQRRHSYLVFINLIYVWRTSSLRLVQCLDLSLSPVKYWGFSYELSSGANATSDSLIKCRMYVVVDTLLAAHLSLGCHACSSQVLLRRRYEIAFIFQVLIRSLLLPGVLKNTWYRHVCLLRNSLLSRDLFGSW
jgi:hypothetical protein